jgi:hypothetical protein
MIKLAANYVIFSVLRILPLLSKYSPQQPLLKHPPPMFLEWGPSFTPLKQQLKYSSVQNVTSPNCRSGRVVRISHHTTGTATGYGLDDRLIGVRFPAGVGNFFSDTMTKPALGPTQPPLQWVPGALSLGVKRPGREADHSLLSSAEVKECVELYFHSPVRPQGMVLS